VNSNYLPSELCPVFCGTCCFLLPILEDEAADAEDEFEAEVEDAVDGGSESAVTVIVWGGCCCTGCCFCCCCRLWHDTIGHAAFYGNTKDTGFEFVFTSQLTLFLAKRGTCVGCRRQRQQQRSGRRGCRQSTAAAAAAANLNSLLRSSMYMAAAAADRERERESERHGRASARAPSSHSCVCMYVAASGVRARAHPFETAAAA
jgi:hypothetical protein